MITIPFAAITDEFSPDLDVAVDAMTAVGMTGAELRVVWGKNIVDLTDEDVDRARAGGRGERHDGAVDRLAGAEVRAPGCARRSIERFQQDVFGSKHTFADQPRLAERAFEVARADRARKIIRVFSYWRTVDPAACFDRIVEALTTLADEAATPRDRHRPRERACLQHRHREETARVLAAIDHPALQLIWDPANALVAGETPYPDGYRHLPAGAHRPRPRKDCHVSGHTPTWGPVGEMSVDWRGQLRALKRDGYRGAVSLETHWTGPARRQARGQHDLRP